MKACTFVRTAISLLLVCAVFAQTTPARAQRSTPTRESSSTDTKTTAPADTKVSTDTSKETPPPDSTKQDPVSGDPLKEDPNQQPPDDGKTPPKDDTPEDPDKPDAGRDPRDLIDANEPPLPESPQNTSVQNPFDTFKELERARVDKFSGATMYRYPLWVPPGRSGMTPKLALTYNSNERKFDSITGFGWSLPTNAIYRSTESGSQKLYSENDFNADIWGNTQELILVSGAGGIYHAENESDFTKYVFQNNTWIATDKLGTRYFFGQSASSRQSDPANGTRVYKWLLSRIEDTNGNFMSFTYVFDQGQVYPEKISYTGFSGNAGIYEVRFFLTPREPYVNFERGFNTATARLVSRIEIHEKSTGTWQHVRTYHLNYTPRNTAVVHLTSITTKGSGEALSLPPISFAYYDRTNLAELQHINFLKEITYPYGGKEYLTYKPSTAYRYTGAGGNADMKNGKLPFVVPTLFEIKSQPEPNGPVYVTAHDYEGGHYFYDYLDAYRKEYAGFHRVTVTDPVGNREAFFFHQSQFAPDNAESALKGEFQDHISKKGKMYRMEIRDSSGNLFEKRIFKWHRLALPDEDPGEGRNFIFLEREVAAAYDGNADYRATATTYAYDALGNETQMIQWGKVILNNDAGDFTDADSDKIVTGYEYAQNSAKYMHAYMSRSRKYNHASALIGENRYFYDGLALNALNKGSLTRVERQIDANNIAATQAAYNTYGLPVSITNARNYLTAIAYDAHFLHPVLVTNPLSQQTQFQHDYRFGVQKRITDPNGKVEETQYDSLGRVLNQSVSNPTLPPTPVQLLQAASYQYHLNQYPPSIKETKHAHRSDVNNQPIDIDTHSYFDGLGRLIQTRTEAEGVNKYSVINRTYDERGLLKKQIVPQPGSDPVFKNIDATRPGNTFSYDALGRQTAISNPLGTTTIMYDNWEQRITDPNGKRKDLLFDGRKRLSAVKEYLGATPHTTSYAYNGNDQLIQITDALGNVRSMTYDWLGRRLTLTDLHTPNDTTFGTWHFVYDAQGNLISKTDPKAQTIAYSYDPLDRLLAEDLQGAGNPANPEVSFVYDTGTYGIGRLKETTVAQGAHFTNSPHVKTEYSYDLLGRVSSKVHTVENVGHILDFEYHLLGSPTLIRYPGGFEVMYGYNNAGQVERIERKENAVTSSVITNVDYAPHGQISLLAFANGVTTTNTYDIQKLYRLTDRDTLKAATRLQDINYVYDPVGNLTTLTDNAQNNLKKTAQFTYDDLHRLTSVNVTNTGNNQNYTQSYAYDILGNIMSKSDIGNYTYSGNNPATSSSVWSNPHAVTQAGAKNFTHDKHGNITSDGTWNHVYNFKDRMVESSGTLNGNSVYLQYLYDHEGNRVQKNNVTSSTSTVYVDKYYDDEGGTKKRHIYLGELKVATDYDPQGGGQGGGNPLNPNCIPPQQGDWTVTTDCTFTGTAIAPASVIVQPNVVLTIAHSATLGIDLRNYKLLIKHTGGVLIKHTGAVKQMTGAPPIIPPVYPDIAYHHSDHLSGTSVDTDENGSVLQLLDYHPFGTVRLDERTGSYNNDYTFTGKELDEETGLHYFGARYYEGRIGRFTSVDPVAGFEMVQTKVLTDPQALNTYAYARNNPLKYVDPSGEFAFLAPVVGGIIGAGVAFFTADVNVANAPSLETDLSQPSTPAPSIAETAGNSAQQFLSDNGLGMVGAGLGLAIGAANIYNDVRAFDIKGVKENGSKIIKNLPFQKHHVVTDKSRRFTPGFEGITKKYDLDLKDDWNIVEMPHQGRHPNEYHQFIQRELQRIDQSAKGNKDAFMQQFNELKKSVRDNPESLRKSYYNTNTE